MPVDASVDAVLVSLEGHPALSKRAGEWRRQWAALAQGTAPRVVFTGDAKAGRSTLLNHIVGRRLLRTAVRACTPVPVTVFVDGWQLVEVPPGGETSPVDGRVLVVDVRQPLPRRAPVVPDGGGPTVVVLTKLDRAEEDAVLSVDPSAEVGEAVAEAVRRARRRCAEPPVDVIQCDARDAAQVRAVVWPRLVAGLAGARDQAAARGIERRGRWLRAVAADIAPEDSVTWPPTVAVDAVARDITQAALTAAMAALAADRDAWHTALSVVTTHRELEARLARVDDTILVLLRAALAQARSVVAPTWTDRAGALRDAVDSAWHQHTSAAVPPATPLPAPPPPAPDFAAQRLAASLAKDVRQAGNSAVPGLARLQGIDRRKRAVASAWMAALRSLETDLGAALWDDVIRQRAALQGLVDDRVAWLEAAGAAELRAAEQTRTEERLARWHLRDILLARCGGGPPARGGRTV